MIYFYYGDDSFRAKETVDSLKKKFIELYDPSGHNTVSLHQSDMTLESFFEVVKAHGFLSKKKFILVHNIFSHKDLKNIQEPIIAYLKSVDNTTDENYIIFHQEGVPRKNSKLFTTLRSLTEKKNCSKQFDLQTGAALTAWIQKKIERYKKTISPDVARYLVENVGNDSWRLHHEIHKLCYISRSHAITQDDIDMVTIGVSSDNIFQLLDAIGMKQHTTALSLLDDSFEAEEENARIIHMLVRQYRLIARAKELRKTTRNEFSIAQSLGLPPFIAKKIVSQSELYTSRDLIAIYDKLLDLDQLLKSDPGKTRIALTDFIAQL